MNEKQVRFDFEQFIIYFDYALIALVSVDLFLSFFLKYAPAQNFLIVLSIIGLFPVLVSSVKSLMVGRLSVDLLATIALLFSFLSHEWYSAAFIILMLAFARLFDHVTESRSKKTIQSLLKYHVEKVIVKVGDSLKEFKISEVKIGDLVVVETGERVPVDGTVYAGEAYVDESTLTGESDLVTKKKGDRVFTSTINDSGSLIVQVTAIGQDTTLSKMIKLVDEASREKNVGEKLADRFAQWYISLSLFAAVIMYFLGLSTTQILAVLLVVCADDIAVAIPLAFTVGISHAASRGVIIKGSKVMEQLSKMEYLFTDKTGTLTRGQPAIVAVKAFHGMEENTALRFFASGAAMSKHAVAKAILGYSELRHISVHVPEEVKEFAGQGTVYQIAGQKMIFGRLSFLEQRSCEVSKEMKDFIDQEKLAGRGVSCLAVQERGVAVLSYRDELRPRAKVVIGEMKDLGIKEWHMLSGDNEKVAAMVASELGIEHFHANMTPEDKVDFIRHFKDTLKNKKIRSTVGFMGDGANDAASLSLADVSIAMGGIGADASIEASDITMMKDRLSRLPEVYALSKKCMQIVKGNFWIWAITNGVGLTLVALHTIGPAGAATYNFLTDFIPIANAFRIVRSRRF